MSIKEHLDKNNLHHAYLIEGSPEEIILELSSFFGNLGIETVNNPDFCHISLDSFKIEDARNLKSFEYEKGFTGGRKIFLISANNFLLEAQNTLLKIFEEPIENTHFFIIVPNVNTLLKTFTSRFYVIKNKTSVEDELEMVKKFISSKVSSRIEMMKEFLIEKEEEERLSSLDSNKIKALKFLNALEVVLHEKYMSKKLFDINCFKHIFKVREFINQPGSSVKTLMESVALCVPEML